MTISRWIHHKKNPCQVPEAKPHTDLQTRCFRAGGEGRGSRKSNGGMSSTLQVVCREAKSSVRRVGLLYDDRMRKHRTPDGDHPENPDRIDVIWDKLLSNKIPQRCEVLTAKEAEDKHLLTVHSGDHVNLIRNISSIKFDSRREYIASKWNSIYLNEGSSEAAYLAAGSVIEVAERVAKGELKSAAAIVRPPGHHAEHDEAMGFCLFNNVAVATSVLLNLKPELGIEKILIVDWDVHHGNGTQKMFWKDPRVLFFSVHRHEFGKFYPGNDDGFYTMVGGGPGAGFNINVPWENGGCGDADYFAVWDHILIPVAKEFEPDMIIVSAGFDAAVGDPLGGCHVTPYGYSMMLKKLMDFAQGKIVLALEGGYNLASIANSFLGCMKVLLEDKCCKIGRKKNSNKNRDITELQDYSVHRFVTRSMTKDPNNKPISGSSEAYPFESSWLVIKEVRKELSAYWPILALPLVNKTATIISLQLLISSSDSEGEDKAHNIVPRDLSAAVQEVMEPLLKLKLEDTQGSTSSTAWRTELSKIEIWYATFGSNMWRPRFLCYIKGGQVDGMRKSCAGSMDRNLPRETIWKAFPHRLFFGRDSTKTWGAGGVAFLHPESDVNDTTYMCLYRITYMKTPAFDLAALNTIENERTISLELLKSGWYHNVVYLGKENDIPILTMIIRHVKSFKTRLMYSLEITEFLSRLFMVISHPKNLLNGPGSFMSNSFDNCFFKFLISSILEPTTNMSST
ncbi:hypothetical protein K2173_008797 [Erythroxylum novogranatense]|uniref:histone deacetylase n=1 Tax=Erythroxylum novogranatense TaxID=1862640 RepID=A0AAV8SLA2_9ROSI|nr:hypothetical protein K2173_008797 [Erythroxylum novogranatense]